jgi:TolA-binding protein
LRQGEALAKDGHSVAARAYFRELVRDYPGTPEAAKAAQKAAELASKERVR